MHHESGVSRPRRDGKSEQLGAESSLHAVLFNTRRLMMQGAGKSSNSFSSASVAGRRLGVGTLCGCGSDVGDDLGLKLRSAQIGA